MRLAELTRRLVAALGNVAREAELPREWLETMAGEHLRANRAHMRTEEQDLLPRANALPTDEDWREIDAAAVAGDDPVFGKGAAADYQRLHRRILALHG